MNLEKPDVVYVIFIASTPEAIWRALTSPEFTSKYWAGRRIESDWVPGSPVRHVRPDGGADWQGEVLEADPPRRLAYTFHMSLPEVAAEPPTVVRFEIDQIGEMVRLRLTHEHVDAGTITRQKTMHGWPAIMSSLKSLLETGKPLPFTGLGFAPEHAGREGTL
jgi:uncharacterized protein YndB with AHSA1/START domain